MAPLTRSELDRVSLEGLKLYTADNGNPVVFMNNAFWLECEPNDTAFTEPVKRTGNWEAWVATAIYNELNNGLPDVDFYDVGANVGYYSMLAGSLGVPRILAVEPNPDLVPMIERSAELNNYKITVEEFCASSTTDEIVKLYKQLDHSGANSTYGTGEDYYEVSTAALDNRCFNADNKKVVKCDVEGAERDVWNGAQSFRELWQNIWFLEWVPERHGKDYNREWLNEVLQTHDILMVDYDGSLRAVGVEEALNVEFETIVFRSR